MVIEASPPLIHLGSAEEYQRYYKAEFCVKPVFTSDGLRVHFSEGRFWHAFCTSDAQGKKDKFSTERAQHIGWIRPTLECPNAVLRQGWNATQQCYEPNRRVSVVYEGFIVVLEVGLTRTGVMRANFITAFPDKKGNAVAKIAQAPLWDKELCEKALKELKEKGR